MAPMCLHGAPLLAQGTAIGAGHRYWHGAPAPLLAQRTAIGTEHRCWHMAQLLALDTAVLSHRFDTNT